MNLKTIRNVLTSKMGRQILVARKHSPALLFGAGIVGVVATAILASRATLKLDEVLEEAQDELDRVRSASNTRYSDEERQRDLVVVYVRSGLKVAKLYAPSVLIGVASIAALSGSHVILSRRNVALTAAYAAVDKAFRQYRDRVVKELGLDKDREFRYGVEEREIIEEGKNGPVVKTVKWAGVDGASMYARFFDEGNANWSPQPGYNMMFLKCQQQYANDLLHRDGYLILNDVYQMLGLKRTSEGAVVGWVLDGGASDNYVDFGIFDSENQGLRDFMNGWSKGILLDFNVDGVMYDKI